MEYITKKQLEKEIFRYPHTVFEILERAFEAQAKKKKNQKRKWEVTLDLVLK